MEQFKRTVASNITTLRIATGLTQVDLGEKLNYSDKSISKWERAEALPDAYVLKQMADIFGVTVDYLLTHHESNTPLPVAPTHRYSRRVITSIAFCGVWTAALLAFVVVWLAAEIPMWQFFVGALPVSLMVVMILHFLWGKKLGNFLLISAFLWSLLLSIFLCLLPTCNTWPLFLIGIPAQIIILLSFNVKKRQKRN